MSCRLWGRKLCRWMCGDMQDCLQDARRIVVAFPARPLNRPEQSAESVPWIASYLTRSEMITGLPCVR